MEFKQDKFIVKTYECQADGNIKLFSLMQHLQEAAAVHAEQLGFGRRMLNEIDGYWVLSNLRIEIGRFPKWNEEVTLETWPSGYTRLLATREFIGRDQRDRESFRASSEWMILDKRSGRPRNLLRLELSLPECGPRVIMAGLNRLQPQDGYIETDRVRVPHSAIDLNGHANNTECVRWGLDALQGAFKFSRAIRFMHATYLSEVFEGDELDILVHSEGEGRFYVLGRKSDVGSNVFLIDVGC